MRSRSRPDFCPWRMAVPGTHPGRPGASRQRAQGPAPGLRAPRRGRVAPDGLVLGGKSDAGRGLPPEVLERILGHAVVRQQRLQPVHVCLEGLVAFLRGPAGGVGETPVLLRPLLDRPAAGEPLGRFAADQLLQRRSLLRPLPGLGIRRRLQLRELVPDRPRQRRQAGLDLAARCGPGSCELLGLGVESCEALVPALPDDVELELDAVDIVGARMRLLRDYVAELLYLPM
mmetsp:Transcript_86214/g.244389  ORF Transcript_86214/g.244389 Transcript_86214/m.244389 type:complete len:230 (+) Transcript_86214:80-769(+)